MDTEIRCMYMASLTEDTDMDMCHLCKFSIMITAAYGTSENLALMLDSCCKDINLWAVAANAIKYGNADNYREVMCRIVENPDDAVYRIEGHIGA